MYKVLNYKIFTILLLAYKCFQSIGQKYTVFNLKKTRNFLYKFIKIPTTCALGDGGSDKKR